MRLTDRTLRVVTGGLTATYGLTVLMRPSALLGPAGLTQNRTGVRLARALGLRDLLSGISVALAPEPYAEAAVLTRVAADASDVVTFGLLCPARAKAKACAVATGWGLVCALGHPQVAARLGLA